MKGAIILYSKFAYLCKINKVKPYEVSKATGISTSTFSDWKSGRSKPKIEKLIKIADYFGVDVMAFFRSN